MKKKALTISVCLVISSTSQATDLTIDSSSSTGITLSNDYTTVKVNLNTKITSDTIGISNENTTETLYNSGTIYGYTAAINNTGTIGTLTNDNIVYSDALTAKGIDNAGTIGKLTNNGYFSGETVIDNAGTIETLTNDYIIQSYDGKGIDNAGTIGTLTNNFYITGSGGTGINNAGTIETLTNSDGGYIYADLTAITNTGTIDDIGNASGGAIVGITSGIDNAGTINTLNNAGEIGSSEGTAYSVTGINNVSGGTIGTLTNSGTIAGTSDGIDNAGTIDSIVNSATGVISGDTYAINNTGTVTNGINNWGTLSGRVALGSASLNLLGSAASVTGEITGDTGSSVNVGNTDTTTAYTATANATAGKISVASGSSLTLSDDINWSATADTPDAVTNKGTVTLSSGNELSGNITNYGTIDGNLSLGADALTLLGSSAAVTGIITGDTGSSLNVGNTDTTTAYTATANATAGKISVTSGSALTLADGLSWTATDDSDDAVSNSGSLTLDSDSFLTGNLTNTGTTTLATGSSITGDVDNSGTLALSTGYAVSAGITGDVTNSGTIVLNPTPTSAGNTLTINGDYSGSGGTLTLGTVLGDDTSLTDKLVITGSASGTTYVSVTNENGSGARTLEGIEVIDTGASSAGSFVQAGRIVAGAYDYHLQQGNTSQDSDSMNNWYLTSAVKTSGGTVAAVRPEIAAYTANLQAANTLFSLRLNDRTGETVYTNPVTGQKETTTLWMRNEGGHSSYSMGDGQNKTQANRYVLQLGGDLLNLTSTGDDSLRVGVTGGYGNQHSSTYNNVTGYRAEADIHGYSTGLYGTWYQNVRDESGLYVDIWGLYNWFNNDVKGEDMAEESYRSHGVTASAETGYTWNAYRWSSDNGMTNRFNLQPQLQVTWAGVKADDHTESNGTFVQDAGTDNVQTRAGMKAYLVTRSSLDKETDREFRPFLEANWIYNTNQYGTSMNGTTESIKGTRNIGELKTGVEAKLTGNFDLWATVAQQMGGSGYSDTSGAVGMKYRF